MSTSRLPLAILPTPLHRLSRLSEELGADIWIKRDDLTGFGCGGNKVRKAEFLLADALSQGADTLITAGAAQSNHARVIAAAAGCCGMECHLVLSGPSPERPSGNLLLDRLSDATLHFVSSGAEREARMQSLAAELKRAGRRPYVIPIGGSNVVGARGYVHGFRELDEQLRQHSSVPTSLYFATSSGGTYAGLLAGQAACSSRVKLAGIRVDNDPNPEENILTVANALAQELSIEQRFGTEGVCFNDEYVGEGYGIPSAEGMAALRMVWRLEGILLDPVYSAKAMAALIARAPRAGSLAGERAVFLHTGGGPSVFAAPWEWFT